MQPASRFHKGFLIVSMVLFGLSLTQQAYCTQADCADSIMVLILGWWAMLSGGAGLCWLANPLLVACWLSFDKKPKQAMFLAAAAFLLAFFFLLANQVVADENGNSRVITGRKAGYWLWLASHFTMLAGTYIAMYKVNLERRKAFLQQQAEQRDYLH